MPKFDATYDCEVLGNAQKKDELSMLASPSCALVHLRYHVSCTLSSGTGFGEGVRVRVRACVRAGGRACVRAWQGRGATAPKGAPFRESLGKFPANFSKVDVISSFLPNWNTLQLLCSGPRRHENELSTRYKIWFYTVLFATHIMVLCCGIEG